MKKGLGKKIIIGVATAAIAIITLIVIAGIKTEIPVKITGFEYNAKITFEEYKLVTEEDWTLPAGAEKLTEFRAIHHYDKVPDGYITKTRQVQVQTGTKKLKLGLKISETAISRIYMKINLFMKPELKPITKQNTKMSLYTCLNTDTE